MSHIPNFLCTEPVQYIQSTIVPILCSWDGVHFNTQRQTAVQEFPFLRRECAEIKVTERHKT